MITINTYTVNFDQPVEKVYEALTDTGFWEKVVNRFSAADGKVEKFDITDTDATVVIYQTVSTDKIPAQAQKFVKSGVGMARTFVISPPNGDGATSTAAAEVSDIPVSFSTSQKLIAQGEDLVLTTNSEFVINMSLLDDKLEEEAAPHLERILNVETAVPADYVVK